MTIVDANLLLYAYNADAPQQDIAARWLTDLFKSGEIVAIPQITAWAFIRICTNPRLWDSPMSAREAFGIVGAWLAMPDVIELLPGPKHWSILQRLVTDFGASGSLVTDAILAALAIENGAVLASADQDFARFRELRWLNPLV